MRSSPASHGPPRASLVENGRALSCRAIAGKGWICHVLGRTHASSVMRIHNFAPTRPAQVGEQLPLPQVYHIARIASTDQQRTSIGTYLLACLLLACSGRSPTDSPPLCARPPLGPVSDRALRCSARAPPLGPVSDRALRCFRRGPPLGPVSDRALRCSAALTARAGLRPCPPLLRRTHRSGRSPTVPSAASVRPPLGPVSDRALRCSARAHRLGRSPTVPSAASRAPTARAGLRPCPPLLRARPPLGPVSDRALRCSARAPTARAGLRPCPPLLRRALTARAGLRPCPPLLRARPPLGPVSDRALRCSAARHRSGRSPTVPSAAPRAPPLGPVSDRALRCLRAHYCSGRSPTVPSAAPRGDAPRGRSPTVPSHHSIVVRITSLYPGLSSNQYAADENLQAVGSSTSPLRFGLSCR